MMFVPRVNHCLRSNKVFVFVILFLKILKPPFPHTGTAIFIFMKQTKSSVLLASPHQNVMLPALRHSDCLFLLAYQNMSPGKGSCIGQVISYLH